MGTFYSPPKKKSRVSLNFLNYLQGGYKQEQTLFKRSAAGFEKVLIVWQSFTAVKKEKRKKLYFKSHF